MKRILVVALVAACGSDDSMTEDPNAPIVIGQTGATTGTNQSLGNATKLGVELAFAEQNAAGGIHGHPLQLQFRDDAYTPDLADTATRELLAAQSSPTEAPHCPSSTIAIGGTPVTDTALTRGPNAVLAMIGSVGSPTALRQAAITVETQTVYFGAFTGATSILRDAQTGACAHYLFNVRASYAQEARATLELFMARGVPDYKNLISFDQNDTYGDSGYNGLVSAYTEFVGAFPTTADPTTPIKRFRYARNDDTSVPAQATAMTAYLTQLLTDQAGTVTVGVMMTDTYGAASELIKQVRTWQYDGQQAGLQKTTRLKLHFSNVSIVGSNALGERLVALGTFGTATNMHFYTEDVYVSQVVPNYQNDASAIVGDYNRAIGSGTPSFMSLEAFITARVLIAGLLAHEGPFTPEAVAATLESQAALPVGLDGTYGFSTMNHQYSNSVWGTAIQHDGSFANLYVWHAGEPIQIVP